MQSFKALENKSKKYSWIFNAKETMDQKEYDKM